MKLTLEDAYQKEIFKQKSISQVRWLSNGARFSYVLDKALWIVDTETGEGKIAIPADKKLLGNTAGVGIYVWSPDEAKILVNGRGPARFTAQADYALADVPTGDVKRLTNSRRPQRNGKLSPDGKRLGLIRSDDLWVIDLATGEEKQLTSLGTMLAYVGRFGWVYEEELGLVDGWQWSPDGDQIAFYVQDEKRVPEFSITDFSPKHPRQMSTRYPQPGDPNPSVRIGVISSGGGDITWMDTQHEENGYLSFMQWTPKGQLLIQRMPRLQNRLDLLLCNPITGACEPIITETSEQWVDGQGEVRFLKDGSRFLWLSDRHGWKHIYLYDIVKGLIGQLTKGEFDAGQIVGVDEGHALVYYVAAAPKPYERNLYSVSLTGGEPSRVTTGRGVHGVDMAPDAKHYIGTHSDLDSPPETALYTSAGKRIKVLIARTIDNLDKLDLGKWELLNFKTSDGVKLNARMLKPKGFDTKKRYPVLMHTYGGPGSQVVMDSWGGDWLSHYLAQEGYVTFLVDNRGTGARGAEFMKCTYLNLGKWEAHDQIEGAKYVGKQPFVDPKKIALWGWSYGGYLSSLAVLLGEGIFRAGLSVAPVTHWELYDTIYTERYMRTPEENPDGYKQSAPETHADKLNAALLIVHGTADDNVHFQNSVRLVTALQKAGKPFETMFYPGKKHGIDGMRYHIYKMFERFLEQNLK